jgi:two-component system sensor histidine kinase/response regulator
MTSNDQKANILLVDDRLENLLALESVLGELGQTLYKARSSKEALRLVLQHDFAVILLDVQMPDVDGFETAAVIRARERSKHIPIIFITALGTSEPEVVRGYSIGAVDYLFKPFMPEILKSKVSVFVELHLMRMRLRDQADQLAMMNQALQEEIAEHRRADEEVKLRTAQLEIANQELEAFSYSVSHDLRAPVRHLDGFATLFQQHAGAVLDDKGKRYLTIISESAKRMGTLIDDLLAFSRMGRVELCKSTVSLNRVVEEVLQELRPDTETRNIAWTLNDLPVVEGDPSLLRQVLVNLLSNAVKYTKPRELARIEIGRCESEPHEIVIFVRDNGAGFDMRYADKLFGVFQRLHGATEFEGTGIGLANVRRIIHRHGGRTWAEGKVGEGATFYISLPVPEVPVPPTPDQAALHSDARLACLPR